MESILKAFAQGNLLTAPNRVARGSKQAQAAARLAECEAALTAVLDPPTRALLDNLEAAHWEVEDLAETDRFVYGYRLGVWMTVEAFFGRDPLSMQEDG